MALFVLITTKNKPLAQLLQIEHEHKTVYTESKKMDSIETIFWTQYILFRAHAQFAGVELIGRILQYNLSAKLSTALSLIVYNTELTQ